MKHTAGGYGVMLTESTEHEDLRSLKCDYYHLLSFRTISRHFNTIKIKSKSLW